MAHTRNLVLVLGRPSAGALITVAAVVLAVALGVSGWPQLWWQPGELSVRPGAFADSLVLVETTALVLWRWPLACFALAELAMIAYGALGYPASPADYAALVATAVAAWGLSEVARWSVLAVSLAGMLGVAAARPQAMTWAGALADVALVGFAWGAGTGVRSTQEVQAARAHLARETLARETAQQRLRMAECLHDRVGASLALATRQLEAAQVVDTDRSRELVSSVLAQLRTTFSELADLVTTWSQTSKCASCHSSAANRRSLFEVLSRWQSALAEAGTELRVSTRLGPGLLGAGTEALLAAALNEALANFARHSDARSADVYLGTSSGRVRLVVRDAGPARPRSALGTGLEHLKRLLEEAGGSLEAGPLPTGGFCLNAEVPLGWPEGGPT